MHNNFNKRNFSMVSSSTISNVMLAAVLFVFMSVSVQCTRLGGYEAVDVNDEDVKKYAEFAVGELNAAMNNLFYMKETKILEASFQMVSGKNYYLKIELSPTVCTKSDKSGKDVKSCELLENSHEKPQICEVHVWVQAWLKKTTMTDYKCNAVND